MAGIEEYNAPALTLNPSERGITATVQAARRVQGAYNEIAAAEIDTGRRIAGAVEAVGNVAVKYVEHREISQGAKEFAKMQANATAMWNEQAKNADPNDPTLAPKFLQETLEPALEKFGQGFLTEGGQKWMQTRIDSFRNHMTTKVQADQATMAGHALAVNLDQTKNALSSTVRNDPSSVMESIKTWDETVKALVSSSPSLNAVQASKVQTELLQHGKSEIVKSSLIGLAAQNPEAAMKAIESGQFAEFISGAEAKAIVANAKQQIRSERIDQTYQRQQEEVERKRVSDVAENEYLKALRSEDPQEVAGVSAKTIVNDDRLTNPTKEKLLGYLDRWTKPEAPARVSQQTSMQLFSRIHADADDHNRLKDTGPIDKAFIDGKLTRTDHNWLRNEFVAARNPEGQAIGIVQKNFLATIKPLIDKSNLLQGTIDAPGSEQYYRFQHYVAQQVANYRREGKDPFSLFDPSKPDYIAKPGALAPFQKPLSESVRDRARVTPQAAPAVPPRMPGETEDQYLARIGARSRPSVPQSQ